MNQILADLMYKYLPTKTVKFNKKKHKRTQWITTGLIKSIAFRDKLYKQLKQTDANHVQHEIIKINLKTYNTILKNSIRSAKRKYYYERFDKSKNNIKNTWRYINEIMNRNTKNNFPDVFVNNGKLINDKDLIANEFNAYFSNIGKQLASSMDNNNNNNNANISFKDFMGNPSLNNFNFQPVNEQSIIKIIDRLKLKTSCGHDGISTKLLKSIKHEVSPAITIIMNQSINTGIFPDKLKFAKVIPIFKKGDKSLFENYRPISILPAVSKNFERVIFDQLYAYFVTNELFCNSQYGFKKKHSTERAALELIDKIILDRDKGKIPINIYLDLSKAFDTLDHSILLHKLNHYGINGAALQLLKCYLNNRKQYVQIGSSRSKYTPIELGVPQGSILGPLLFIIYINDITSSSDLFKFTMYADDTTLFTTLKSTRMDDPRNLLINDELSKISNWLLANKLSLNVKKTKFIVFRMPQKKIEIPVLKIAGAEIECVDHFNLLGITIDSYLKGIGTSHTSKYVFGVFTYLSYRFHTHMNNRGA